MNFTTVYPDKSTVFPIGLEQISIIRTRKSDPGSENIRTVESVFTSFMVLNFTLVLYSGAELMATYNVKILRGVSTMSLSVRFLCELLRLGYPDSKFTI